jgi:hypothetical protein
MNRDQFWLTDAQFSRIAPYLPTDTRGKARVDDRRVISGFIHVLKSLGTLGRRAARLWTAEDATIAMSDGPRGAFGSACFKPSPKSAARLSRSLSSPPP